MNGQAMRFRIGVFVLASMLLFAILLVMFGGIPNPFQGHVTYFISFTDAPGVGPRTPVRRSGVRIGEVKRVELQEEKGIVLVEVSIDEPYRIRENDSPTLVRNLLGGDTSIDLIPKKPGVESAPYPDKTPLTGEHPASVASLLNKAPEMVQITEKTLQDISKSLKIIEDLSKPMNEAIVEIRDLAKETRKVVPELGKTNEEIRKLAENTNKVMPRVGETNDEIKKLVQATNQVMPRIGETNDEIKKLVQATNTLMPEIGKTNQEIQALAKATRETMPELRRTVEEIGATARSFGKLGERVDVLLQTNQDKLVKAVENLNDVLSRVATVFSDENQRNLSATLKNVKTSSENLENVTKSTDELLKESRKIVTRANDIVGRVDATLQNVEKATKPLAERSASIVKNLDESVIKFNKLLTDVQGLLGGLGDGKGTLHRLLNDPSLYNRLDEAACMITKTLPRVDRIMRDMETFADKLARHPETIGVRGAIKPDSGLKESPYTPLPRSRP